LEKPNDEYNKIPSKVTQDSIWNIKAEGPVNEYNESYGSFPNELIEKCLNLWSIEGDIILDPYAGSGQTIRIAKTMKRKAFGFEIDKKWAHLWSDIND
jgi:DNA modification methylase